MAGCVHAVREPNHPITNPHAQLSLRGLSCRLSRLLRLSGTWFFSGLRTLLILSSRLWLFGFVAIIVRCRLLILIVCWLFLLIRRLLLLLLVHLRLGLGAVVIASAFPSLGVILPIPLSVLPVAVLIPSVIVILTVHLVGSRLVVRRLVLCLVGILRSAVSRLLVALLSRIGLAVSTVVVLLFLLFLLTGRIRVETSHTLLP